MAIAIIAITATAVLGALASSISASGQHRSIAAVDAVLKSYAENAKYQIELKSSPLYSDSACATPYTASQLGWTSPAGYAVTLQSVKSWNPTTKTFDSNGPCTNGLQLLTINASGPTGVSDSIQIVVRRPSYQTSDATL